MTRLKLKDVVAGQDLLYVAPDATVAATVERMRERRISAVPVLSGGALAGVFTTTDFARKVVDAGLDPRSTPVARVMSASPRCLDADCQEIEAIRLMHDCGIRHVIVTGAGPTGFAIVTRADFPDGDVAECDDEVEFERRLWEEM